MGARGRLTLSSGWDCRGWPLRPLLANRHLCPGPDEGRLGLIANAFDEARLSSSKTSADSSEDEQ